MQRSQRKPQTNHHGVFTTFVQSQSAEKSFLPMFSLEELVGAADGKEFAGSTVDVRDRNFADFSAWNEAVLVAYGQEAV